MEAESSDDWIFNYLRASSRKMVVKVLTISMSRNNKKDNYRTNSALYGHDITGYTQPSKSNTIEYVPGYIQEHWWVGVYLLPP